MDSHLDSKIWNWILSERASCEAYAAMMVAVAAASKISEASIDLCQSLIDSISLYAVENGVSVVALHGYHTKETGLESADMLLGVDDLLAFRMKAHGRIARMAYDHGLCGAVSAEENSVLDAKFGGPAGFYTDPQNVKLYKREGGRLVAA